MVGQQQLSYVTENGKKLVAYQQLFELNAGYLLTGTMEKHPGYPVPTCLLKRQYWKK